MQQYRDPVDGEITGDIKPLGKVLDDVIADPSNTRAVHVGTKEELAAMRDRLRRLSGLPPKAPSDEEEDK